MTAPRKTPRGLTVFDAARAVAAFAVLLAHARSFVLLDATRQPSLGWLGRLVFALTGFGHQAVIVFFVISGALVTRAMLAMHRRGAWSAVDFAAARLTRLWLVLIPCLLLGALQDRLGLALTDPLALGAYGAPGTRSAAVNEHLGGVALIGNLAFLQGFAVPAFGSNVPLWTLAVEAWCYVYGFGLFALWRARRVPRRVACHLLCMGGLALGLMTPAFWLLMPIWLVGAAVAFGLPRTEPAEAAPTPAGTADRITRAIALGALGLALIGARGAPAQRQIAADYLLACVTAGALLALARWRPASRRSDRAVRFAAGFSYSLYLSHFPLLALLSAVLLGGRPLPFGASGMALIAVAVALAVGQALLLWWVFERRTGLVRAAVTGWLRGPAAMRLAGWRALPR